ncbi:nuclear transport factor 2 family protein [Pontibacter sp. KCTC 32443]|uniref:nuclear transport factor 2 family protein n=1 Tax=Pontibacter TaxID=323449 RepID=UPI00164CF0F6|nr:MULTISPECIES: nuclear transport factor 2 family protein [Pontibacter]MBC5773164.1 nuclear transport factor 2 family protein [Pontibacter sp. KCTC 32443]
MPNSTIQQTIENYINAYNNFNVEGMLAQIHLEVEFENIVNGQVTLSIKGIDAFKAQAEEATKYFTQRDQKITQLTITDHTAETQIDYTAILAIDLPNGLKAGDKLELKGRSVFTFKDGKIIRLQDYS